MLACGEGLTRQSFPQNLLITSQQKASETNRIFVLITLELELAERPLTMLNMFVRQLQPSVN